MTVRTVAIVGSRRFNDYDRFVELLGDLPMFDRVVSGGASGVDGMAHTYALATGKAFKAFLPDTSRYRTFTAAAHARNQQIVDEADLVIAMPGQLAEYIKVKSLRPFLPNELVPAENDQIPALIQFDTGGDSTHRTETEALNNYQIDPLPTRRGSVSGLRMRTSRR